jgi:methylated-DNA-[protein]-cysteine S-methyltransferase
MFQKIVTSPLGNIKITATSTGLTEVIFIEADETEIRDASLFENEICLITAQQLEQYFSGNRKHFEIPLSPSGTTFQQNVWQELLKIPFGKSSTYSAIANDMNNPLSVRAVGMANGKNPISIIIPCHRVIGADGSLTGYAGGLWRKEALLKLEEHPAFIQPTLW